MAKKLGKNEKLDLILSELSALRAEVKTLLKEGGRSAKAASARARPAPAKKVAKRTQSSRKPAKVPAKPVLVDTDDDEPQPASRIA
ncbi:MAG TPA: hypothetical protein VFR19_02215 [Hyphomicrobiaceae bacterium]|jgi:hypothetical protein|nr:hypothetical protein [Hyphomicrobiaceae bacterium]